MTTQKIAKQIYNNFIKKTCEDGSVLYTVDKLLDWQVDIIKSAYLDRVPSNDICERIHNILDLIANSEYTEEVFSLLEPDIYTNNITKWLHSDDSNVYYISEALECANFNDGFALLSEAQHIYLREIAYTLIDAIDKYISLHS